MRKKREKKQLVSYLAGPMEWAINSGRNWRIRYKQEFDKIGVDCIIPEFEEKLITNQADLNELKKDDMETYVYIMRELIKLDLDFVESVDFVVVRWAGERMSGTIGEVQHAFLVGTPAYLVTTKDLTEVPGWFLACFTDTFTSLKDLTEYIRERYNVRDKS